MPSERIIIIIGSLVMALLCAFGYGETDATLFLLFGVPSFMNGGIKYTEWWRER